MAKYFPEFISLRCWHACDITFKCHPWIKRLGCEADHSPPSNAEVNDWSYMLPLLLMSSWHAQGQFDLFFTWKTSKNIGTMKE
jgi:hypothetical protein